MTKLLKTFYKQNVFVVKLYYWQNDFVIIRLLKH